jgi:hypothetical protein
MNGNEDMADNIHYFEESASSSRAVIVQEKGEDLLSLLCASPGVGGGVCTGGRGQKSTLNRSDV